MSKHTTQTLQQLSDDDLKLVFANIKYPERRIIGVNFNGYVETEIGGHTRLSYDWIYDYDEAHGLMIDLVETGCSLELLDNCVTLVTPSELKIECFYDDVCEFNRAILICAILKEQG